jgi:hypothetical protein
VKPPHAWPPKPGSHFFYKTLGGRRAKAHVLAYLEFEDVAVIKQWSPGKRLWRYEVITPSWWEIWGIAAA